MELAVNASLSKAVVTDASVDVEKSQLAAIRSEMAMFESSGKRGRGLELVYRYLLNIPPSSVDAERAFSAARKCDQVYRHAVFSALLLSEE